MGVGGFKTVNNKINNAIKLYDMQGFLQLDYIGSQRDPLLRIIGHHETLEGRTICMLQNKG